MPVTVKPASHGPRTMNRNASRLQSPLELLKRACEKESKACHELLQSSFDTTRSSTVDASSNGFVKGAIKAYNQHYHLRIRPEDIWFAILSQLSLYINVHAEELRGQFVAHEGKKELELKYDGSRYTVDFGLFAKQMGELIEKNVVDPELRRWMMPAFTTTSPNDVVVASILLMGATQKYFDFKCCIMCGLPSVTLLGEKADWELILTRIEKLKEYGEEPTQFYNLLKPVISRFVTSFDKPTSKQTIDFWQHIAHHLHGGSGPSYYSGWITAFCFWDADGKSMYRSQSSGASSGHTKDVDWQEGRSVLKLDGVAYHLIESDEVPPGYTSVPVKVDDNGYEFMATMVAGSVGTKYISSKGPQAHCDTVQPESGWWMFQNTKEQPEAKRLVYEASDFS
ncbi:MAG: hypothetical protein Q9166_001714 [cf. Caloplaca sp. 2 TL-2023]